MEVISKSKVLDFIENIRNQMYDTPNDYKDVGAKQALDVLEECINSIETKEINLDELLSNLDKDIKEFVTTEEFERDSAVYGHYWVIAKHAFLLGIKKKWK